MALQGGHGGAPAEGFRAALDRVAVPARPIANPGMAVFEGRAASEPATAARWLPAGLGLVTGLVEPPAAPVPAALALPRAASHAVGIDSAPDRHDGAAASWVGRSLPQAPAAAWRATVPGVADSGASAAHTAPVLEATLERAVSKGYIPAHEHAAVRARIDQLAERYGFDADDFAMVGLIESDGFNPRASNGRCYGIIQFCDGPARGAASVGMADNPRAILRMSVLEQLELVDRYFADTGLHNIAQPGLADLYLTVLTPAARREQHPDKALNIAGTQARVLYEGENRDRAITRRSLDAGLRLHAERALGATAEALATAQAAARVKG